MEDYVLKLQEDLRKRLDRLCWMHNEPTLQVVERFTELRAQVDYDAERLLAEIQSSKTPKDSNVNETRLEFIRILDEIEKRTGHQPKPDTDSSEVYASLEHSVETFKDSSNSLDDLEDLYVQLARKIISEADRLEKRLLGDQTIIYLPSKDQNQLGHLVYFGDVFLSQREIRHLIRGEHLNEDARRPHSYSDPLLVRASEPDELSKSKHVVQRLYYLNSLNKFSKASKFVYIGKTKEEYSGYSAEGSSVDREFVSYQIDKMCHVLSLQGNVGLNTSANLFDVFSSTECRLCITEHRLGSLHANLLPTPVTRLIKLTLSKVHLESFDSKLLSQFTNLTELKIQATFSKNFQFDLEFLRPLTKLESLELTLPNSPRDFSVFMSLTELQSLKLEGSSDLYVEKLPKLCKAALEHILSAPRLQSLELSCFDIEAIDRKILSSSRCLSILQLERSHIGCNKNTSIAQINPLKELYLTGNSITDLPREVLDGLPNLVQLYLDKNLIRHVNRCDVGMLETLKLDDNPIESIEPNAFVKLYILSTLSLSGCRLESIDSEMFNGLKWLAKLDLSANLIERIEVVAKDGRRINVAKASLSDVEKELVRKQLFKGLSKLELLDLSGNKLKKLDFNCFSNMKWLKELNLSSNKINELSGEARPELLSYLSYLNLSNNQLTAIDKRTLPKSLEYLNLVKNQLKQLDEDFFKEFARLIAVFLSENESTWTVTENTAFANCSEFLKRIYVWHNKSIQVIEGVIAPMPNDRYFECDFSERLARLPKFETLRITRLTPAIVRALQQVSDTSESFVNHLVACFMPNCSIKSLARNPAWQSNQEIPKTGQIDLSWLAKASELRELDFSGNLIETLDDPQLFADLKSINKINLSGNRLSRIHRDAFKCLEKLSTIDLSSNRLSSIDMGLFRQLESLEDLNLSSNGISVFNLARLFRACPRLKSLNLADNQLDERSTAEPIDARTSYCMEQLVLANNRLNEMSFVRDMTRLQHLDLRNNRIETAMSEGGENLLCRIKELTYLDLSGNKISHLTDEMFTHLRGQFKYLNLSNYTNDSTQIQKRSRLI